MQGKAREVLDARCASGGVGLLVAGCLALASSGCPAPAGGDPDAALPDAPVVPPREPIFDAYGSPSAFDVATWNIEGFPKSASTVAIASVTNFDALMEGLPDYEAVLSTHRYAPNSYQKTGLIARKDVITIRGSELILVDQSASMPRPPLRVALTYNGPDGAFEFDAIIIHLKAGFTAQDRQQRETSISLLDIYIRDRLDANANDRIVLLGDFNTDPSESSGDEILAPITDGSELYQFPTKAPAEAGDYSFLPSQAMLDHVVFAGDFAAGATAQVAEIDDQFINFEDTVSDHRPVVAGFAP
ncbi:MAG: hypothetical protein IPL79_17090 [Myxococcales bacterium]|nr:hypothetical protein [Myxococcales bacterium]